MVGLGLTAPLAAQMLAVGRACAHAQRRPGLHAHQARRRRPAQDALVAGADPAQPALRHRHQGPGRLPDLLRAARPASTPTATWCPILAAEIPTVQNGGLAKDGTSVTWRLKKGVQLARRQAVHRRRRGLQLGVRGRPRHRRRDDRAPTASIERDREARQPHREGRLQAAHSRSGPTPSAADRGMIIPKHVFEPFKGAKSREAPANLKPVGTGALPLRRLQARATSSGPSSTRATTCPTGPSSTAIEMKGGGDAASAARAVLQTGEYDYAWNMQVEDDILKRLEQGGKGRVDIWPTGNIEHIQLNFTDPWTEVDGERSSVKTTHPLLCRPRRPPGAQPPGRPRGGRRSRSTAGRARPRANFLNAPSRFRSRNTRVGVQRRQGQPAPGRRRAGSGGPTASAPRTASGSRSLYQTSINAPRQKTQAIVKQAAREGRASRSSSSRWWPRCSSPPTPPTPTPTRTSTPTSRCTRRP